MLPPLVCGPRRATPRRGDALALAQGRGPFSPGGDGSRGSKRRSDGHGRRITGGRKVRSKIRWFTEFCNSHYVSHFAAFFIDARAKRSVAKSFYSLKFSVQKERGAC